MPDGPERHQHENAVEQTIKCLVKMLCGVLELFDRSPAFSSTGQPNKKSKKRTARSPNGTSRRFVPELRDACSLKQGQFRQYLYQARDLI